MVKTPFKVFIKVTYTAKCLSPLRSGGSVERRCAETRRRQDQGGGKHTPSGSPLPARFQTCAARSPKVATEHLNVRILDAWASSSVSGVRLPGGGLEAASARGPSNPPL